MFAFRFAHDFKPSRVSKNCIKESSACANLFFAHVSLKNILPVQYLCDSDNKANDKLNLALIDCQRQRLDESSLAIFR